MVKNVDRRLICMGSITLEHFHNAQNEMDEYFSKEMGLFSA